MYLMYLKLYVKKKHDGEAAAKGAAGAWNDLILSLDA